MKGGRNTSGNFKKAVDAYRTLSDRVARDRYDAKRLVTDVSIQYDSRNAAFLLKRMQEGVLRIELRRSNEDQRGSISCAATDAPRNDTAESTKRERVRCPRAARRTLRRIGA